MSDGKCFILTREKKKKNDEKFSQSQTMHLVCLDHLVVTDGRTVIFLGKAYSFIADPWKYFILFYFIYKLHQSWQEPSLTEIEFQ